MIAQEIRCAIEAGCSTDFLLQCIENMGREKAAETDIQPVTELFYDIDG